MGVCLARDFLCVRCEGVLFFAALWGVGWRLRMALSNGTLRVVSTRVEGGVTAVKRRVGFFCTVVEEDICVGCNGGREEE